MRDYTKIVAWQRADDLTVAVYEATRRFPREEIYGLTSQLRRAASSIPANIAEGASRNSLKEYLQFLYIARGSLAETRYFLHLAQRLGYLDPKTSAPIVAQGGEVFGILYGLISSVEKDAGILRKLAVRVSSLAIFAQVFRL